MSRRAILLLVFALTACAGPTPPSSTTPIVPIPPAPPRGEPDQFTGISVQRLQALLGTPAFIRQDGATEMWRYDAANCHAFFFLYGVGEQRAVRHVETTPQGSASAADPACLKALKKTP